MNSKIEFINKEFNRMNYHKKIKFATFLSEKVELQEAPLGIIVDLYALDSGTIDEIYDCFINLYE